MSIHRQARADAILHYWLTAGGFGLLVIGAVEIALLRGIYGAYAILATIGAVWWTLRMLDHAEEAERRARMWS